MLCLLGSRATTAATPHVSGHLHGMVTADRHWLLSGLHTRAESMTMVPHRAETRFQEVHAELLSLVHQYHRDREAEGLADPLHFETLEMDRSAAIELRIGGAM